MKQIEVCKHCGSANISQDACYNLFTCTYSLYDDRTCEACGRTGSDLTHQIEIDDYLQLQRKAKSMKILVVFTGTAEMEVDIDLARTYVKSMGEDVSALDDFTLAEIYASYVEGEVVELEWDRSITAVSILEPTCIENS